MALPQRVRMGVSTNTEAGWIPCLLQRQVPNGSKVMEEGRAGRRGVLGETAAVDALSRKALVSFEWLRNVAISSCRWCQQESNSA